jgi:hypothetical protein
MVDGESKKLNVRLIVIVGSLPWKRFDIIAVPSDYLNTSRLTHQICYETSLTTVVFARAYKRACDAE